MQVHADQPQLRKTEIGSQIKAHLPQLLHLGTRVWISHSMNSTHCGDRLTELAVTNRPVIRHRFIHNKGKIRPGLNGWFVEKFSQR